MINCQWSIINWEEEKMAKGDDIQERLIDYAVQIIQFCSKLPKTRPGNHVSGQLLRCGTSPASNYGEARGAESKKDFAHKLRIVLKELNESVIWLMIIHRSNLLPDSLVLPLEQEGKELSRIINASIVTAVGKKKIDN
jgi:four helix bundle protein